jgi:hypothetical protein
MNPIKIWLAEVGVKIAKALFKKQYEVSKEKENAKVNTDKSDRPVAGGV